MSSHSPAFKEFLKYQVRNALKAPTKIMMLDAQTSSATASMPGHLGDFSEHSLEAFRRYLEEEYTGPELAAMGIPEIQTFNYRSFLTLEGITTEEIYTSRINAHGSQPVPLYDEFVLFQNVSIKKLTQEIVALRPMPMARTSSSP